MRCAKEDERAAPVPCAPRNVGCSASTICSLDVSVATRFPHEFSTCCSLSACKYSPKHGQWKLANPPQRSHLNQFSVG
jgi:hypothetical protein